MRSKIGKIVFFILVALLIYKLTGSVLEYKTAYEQQKRHIPTFYEIQEELVRRGHNIKIDGIVGKETIAAWDREQCDQYAIEAFRRFAEMEK